MTTRKQLTLFIEDPSGTIEAIRATRNPVQHRLIAAHVTLCREDELDAFDTIIKNIQSVQLSNPIRLQLGTVQRFDDGKGLWIPIIDPQNAFKELRKNVLGRSVPSKEQLPHITLIHPRNATCTDAIFEAIKKQKLPTDVVVTSISLIAQTNGGKWQVMQDFHLLNPAKDRLS